MSHSVSLTYAVTPPSGNPVLLTFKGFDLDDFDNGVGQLQVFVNDHLVVDIPAGLNNLTGSGDYVQYEKTWVNFGPFDITGFVVQGQNTIVFKDLNPFDHFGLVRSVMIVQGNTLLLQVPGARGVYPGHSVVFTFSVPPLVITSFTVSNAKPVVEQQVTFTATYTGGTAPFRCFFSFGDFEFASVIGINGICSVTHDYDYNGTFRALVIIKGASTSDLQLARLTITVTGNAAPDTDLNTTTVALASVDSN